MRVLTVFGTRPEAIKMAPVVLELQRRSKTANLQCVTCVTAQHRQMLDQVLEVFAIHPDIDLDLMQPNQDLAALTARAVTTLSKALEHTQADLVLVQGDTTTAMSAALAAFYNKIPVGHVEAGLRTGNRYSPFPEETNRRVISVIATYHFAPTHTAADALRREGVSKDSVYVTGNTVIDALKWVTAQPPSAGTRDLLERFSIYQPEHASDPANGASRANGLAGEQSLVGRLRTILVTAHRRENFGRPFEMICLALRDIVQRNPNVQILYPVHLNPNVREPIQRILGCHERIHLIEPLSYEPFAHVMKRTHLVLTDSGGIQEEAPSLGIPVLVMRTETERPEGVEAGTVRVVGTDRRCIVVETERLLHDHTEYQRMARAINPYGVGDAAERIVDIVLERLDGHRRRLPD